MITEEEMKERFQSEMDAKPFLWKEWFALRPAIVKTAILKRPPNYLYDLRGQRVFIYSYDESTEEPESEITLTVQRMPYLNNGLLATEIFDVKLDSLKPLCHQNDVEEFLLRQEIVDNVFTAALAETNRRHGGALKKLADQ